jgi:acyl-CoA-binding protein
MDEIDTLLEIKKNIKEPTLEECFNSICKVVQSLDKDGPIKVDELTRLEMYSYYKIATEGINKNKKPRIFHPIERMKWYSWKNNENLSKDEAMEKYCQKFVEIILRLYNEGIIEKYKDHPGDFINNIPRENMNILFMKYIDTDLISLEEKNKLMRLFKEKLYKYSNQKFTVTNEILYL